MGQKFARQVQRTDSFWQGESPQPAARAALTNPILIAVRELFHTHNMRIFWCAELVGLFVGDLSSCVMGMTLKVIAFDKRPCCLQCRDSWQRRKGVTASAVVTGGCLFPVSQIRGEHRSKLCVRGLLFPFVITPSLISTCSPPRILRRPSFTAAVFSFRGTVTFSPVYSLSYDFYATSSLYQNVTVRRRHSLSTSRPCHP